MRRRRLAVLPALAAAADSHSIETRLQAIEDRLAIEDLIAGKYSMALDTGDRTVTPGSSPTTLSSASRARTFNGKKEIRAMMEGILKHHNEFDTRPPTAQRHWGPVRHVVTNPVITITGNTAASDSYSTEIGSNGRDEKGHGNRQSIMNVCRYETVSSSRAGSG